MERRQIGWQQGLYRQLLGWGLAMADEPYRTCAAGSNGIVIASKLLI